MWPFWKPPELLDPQTPEQWKAEFDRQDGEAKKDKRWIRVLTVVVMVGMPVAIGLLALSLYTWAVVSGLIAR